LLGWYQSRGCHPFLRDATVMRVKHVEQMKRVKQVKHLQHPQRQGTQAARLVSDLTPSEDGKNPTLVCKRLLCVA